MPSLIQIGKMVLKKIFTYFQQFFTISLSSPLEEGSGPSFKQTLIPLPKNALYQVWLKLAKWFWRRFLNIFNIILLLCYYLPLEKGVALHLNKLKLYPRTLCDKFGWNWPSGSGEEDENVKSLQQRQRQQQRRQTMDKFWTEKPLAQVS